LRPTALLIESSILGPLVEMKIIRKGTTMDVSLSIIKADIWLYDAPRGNVVQAGVQAFGYVLFFMDDDSLRYLDNSAGWEVGTGPSLVVLDAGFGKNLSTTTMQKGVYAFIFDQKGLMGGIGIQGAKITKLNPNRYEPEKGRVHRRKFGENRLHDENDGRCAGGRTLWFLASFGGAG
jgi:hypothetical protein